MQISITGRHIEITSALREYIEKKATKLVRYFNHIIEAHVILDLEGKTNFIAEITIHANGITIHSEEHSDDMYASIDKMLDKIERQIKKYKEKISNHAPRSFSRKTNVVMNIMRAENLNEEQPMSYKVIKTKRYAVKPMSVEEAIMQMDLMGDDFLVYTGAESDKTNVIYRRKDGTYGLIEKE